MKSLLNNVPCKPIKLTVDVKALTKSETQYVSTSTKGNKQYQVSIVNNIKPIFKPALV